MISALRHLPFTCVFVTGGSRLDLVPVSVCHIQGADPEREMVSFLNRERPDTIASWGDVDPTFRRIWKEKGVRWVHSVRLKSFDPREDWKAAELAVPDERSKKVLSKLGLKSSWLPVPVDTEAIPFRRRDTAHTFTCLVGRATPHHGRGLPELLMAWSEMVSPPRLVIRGQEMPVELVRSLPPESVHIDIWNAPDLSDVLGSDDVAIQPSRYEDTGIMLLEAMAAGMPVITTDALPMKELAPDLLVPSDETVRATVSGKELEYHVASFPDLRRRVETMKGRDISELSGKARRQAESHSWKVLLGHWLKLLIR